MRVVVVRVRVAMSVSVLLHRGAWRDAGALLVRLGCAALRLRCDSPEPAVVAVPTASASPAASAAAVRAAAAVEAAWITRVPPGGHDREARLVAQQRLHRGSHGVAQLRRSRRPPKRGDSS